MSPVANVKDGGSSGQSILNKDDLAVDHDSSDIDSSSDSDADSKATSILV